MNDFIGVVNFEVALPFLPPLDKLIYVQQVPEEIERVMVGVEAYLSIRRHISDIGLSFFEDDDDTERSPDEKV